MTHLKFPCSLLLCLASGATLGQADGDWPTKGLSQGGIMLMLGDSILDCHEGDHRIEVVVRHLLQDKRPSGRWVIYNKAHGGEYIGPKVPSSYHPITFTLYGPGELLEQTWPGHGTGTTWNAIAGMTRIALRATNRTGHAVVSAYSPGLGMGRIELQVSAPGKPDEMEYKERFEVDEP